MRTGGQKAGILIVALVFIGFALLSAFVFPRRDPDFPGRRVGLFSLVSVGLFVRLESKPGKEAEVEAFLRGGLAVVEEEPATVAWFALRLGPSTFGIFDAFPDDAGRQAHLSGRVAAALMAKAPELLARPPAIENADVLAAKLPG